MTVALVVLGARGLALARQVARRLDDCRVHGFSGRADEADVVFDDTMVHLRKLYGDGHAIVGVCAAGILVRALGPLLDDKRQDAPVVALAEDGSVAVPLIGGHRGANALARDLAAITGGIAAITTAGDLQFGFSLDEPPAGWRLGNPAMVKAVTAAMLSGDGARLEGEAPWLTDGPWREDAAYRVKVTEQTSAGDDHTLLVHPAVLAVGVGCERGVAPAELRELVSHTLRDVGLAEAAVAGLASIDLKMDEAAVHELAQAMDRPVRFFPAQRLEAETPRLQNPSEIVFQATGCHGVAEGAALALAGPEARLIVAKRKSQRATCAVAIAPQPIDPVSRGQGRGRLCVVGIGPGNANWRTAEAVAAIDTADCLVGYGLYLDLVSDLAPRAARHGYALGQETDRVREALDLAAEGKKIALICSGDAGIYALGSLVFEMIEAATDDAWRRIDIGVAPGISAMQAAAAKAGAPLGHDFCAISLSDLLTPREVIRQRLQAAAAGNFVTAIYNPQSRTRRDLLTEALQIFRAERSAETPVVVARNLGRSEEAVCLETLASLDVEAVDMLTILIVGNRETRRDGDGANSRVYTPRGYGNRS